jgi:hypothetical protein
MAAVVTVEDVRLRARKLVEREQRTWAAAGGESARLDLPLHPPTERSVLADQGGAIDWVRSWRAAAESAATVEVRWADRQWPSVGAQRVAERVTIAGADAIAAFAGAAWSRDWRLLRERAVAIRAAFADRVVAAQVELVDTASLVDPVDPSALRLTLDPLAAAIRTHGRAIQQLTDADFGTLLHVVVWLVEHPASGKRIRQLPIRGIDTKWVERHRSLVEGLHAAITGRESLGLLGAPNRVLVRFLDPALRPGGLCDVSSPVEELAALAVAPTTVFVFENLETVLAMPELPGAVVVHGSGYAVQRLGSVPWIRDGRIIYWGDLDSDGFAILNMLRSGCHDVTSVLMNEETLLAYRDLWVPEPKGSVGLFPRLTPQEQGALERIRAEGNVRLEQERLPWEFALAVLTSHG